MNLNFIYKENEFQFDVNNDATIKYIKELAQKIFQYEERGLDLLYNEENITNFDDKLKINQLVHEDVKKIIFHLEKKDNTNKNTIVSSNGSTIDSNNNDKYYHSMRKKFLKFNKTYSKIIEEISNFEVKLNSTIENLQKQIKDFTYNILKVNETLNFFYSSDSYDKLNTIFEQNKTQNITEIDLKHLNREIESYILNYKYLTTQHNFQINIIDFIEEKIELLKCIKIKLFKTQNHNNYKDIVLLLDQIFSEIINTEIHIPKKNLEKIDEDYFHSSKGTYLDFHEIKKDINLPKIEMSNDNHKEQSNKISINYKRRNTKRQSQLMKKNNSEILKNNISFSSNNVNKKSLIFDNISSNKLPIVDNNKTMNLKTIDSSQFPSLNNENKNNKISFRSSFLLGEKDNNNNKYKINTKIKDLDNSLIINEIKPIIMEKSDKKLNVQINDKSIKNNLFDGYSVISERRLTKKFPSPSSIKNIENKFEKTFIEDMKGISDNHLSIIRKDKSPQKSMRVSIKLDKDNIINNEEKKKKKEQNDNNSQKENKESTEKKKENQNKGNNEKKGDIENIVNNEKKEIKKKKENNKINKDVHNKNEEKTEKKSSLKKEDNISILKPNQSDINISPIRYQLNQRNNDLISLRRKTKFSFLSTTKSNFKMDFKDETSTHKESSGKKIKLINCSDEQTIKTKNSIINDSKIKKINSKKSFKTQSIEDEKIIHNYNKENNKEQIEKLTKDLLSLNHNIKNKNISKKHLVELIKQQIINLEKEKEKEENENENEISLDDNKSENINEEERKKKKKKIINKYDFII